MPAQILGSPKVIREPMSADRKEKCSVCKKYFNLSDLYEYRGKVACEKDFAEAEKNADAERQEAIEKMKHKTERFRGLDLGDNQIGRANREILKADIEIAKHE